MRRLLSFFIALLLASSAGAAELQVSAAASLTDALQVIGREFGSTHHVTVRFNFAGSDTLATQIGEGAPADVFVSADDAQMDRLARAGLLLPGSRRTIVSNQLVIVIPVDSRGVQSAADLQRRSIRRIALADPQRVPAGIYAKQYLQRVRLWGALAPKVVPTENVRAALSAVDSGNADAAIVYRSDAGISKRVRVAAVISGPQAPAIAYPAAVIKESTQRALAEDFVNFLTSAAARSIFARHGFVVPR